MRDEVREHASTGRRDAIKGESIRDMVKVLTPEQKQIIKVEMAKPCAPGDLSELIIKVFGVPEK